MVRADPVATEGIAPEEQASIYRMDRRIAVAPRRARRLAAAALAVLLLAGAAVVYMRFGLTRTIIVNADQVVVARVAPDVALRYLDMLTEADFVADVQGAATPFLVVLGERDPGLDEAAMRRTFLAWHPNIELAIVRNSGHYPMQECPPCFAGLIETFLKKHAA